MIVVNEGKSTLGGEGFDLLNHFGIGFEYRFFNSICLCFTFDAVYKKGKKFSRRVFRQKEKSKVERKLIFYTYISPVVFLFNDAEELVGTHGCIFIIIFCVFRS